METNDANARLAALQARRRAVSAAPAPRINPLTGRARRHHPARKARIATGAMSVLAMFGITGFMAAHDASASASSVAAMATSGASTNSATSQGFAAAKAAPATTSATTRAVTVTKGS